MIQEKSTAWTGFGKLPPLRRRPGGETSLIVTESESLASAQARNRLALRNNALRWHGKSPTNPDPPSIIIDVTETEIRDGDTLLDVATKRPLKYRKLTDGYMSTATCVKTHRADDLLHVEADSNMLRAWLHIIALGQTVQPKNNASQQIAYKSALKDPHKLYFSEEMADKHANLFNSYHRYASQSSNAWTAVDAGTPRALCACTPWPISGSG